MKIKIIKGSLDDLIEWGAKEGGMEERFGTLEDHEFSRDCERDDEEKRKEGHSALRLKDGELERFDPHPPMTDEEKEFEEWFESQPPLPYSHKMWDKRSAKPAYLAACRNRKEEREKWKLDITKAIIEIHDKDNYFEGMKILGDLVGIKFPINEVEIKAATFRELMRRRPNED